MASVVSAMHAEQDPRQVKLRMDGFLQRADSWTFPCDGVTLEVGTHVCWRRACVRGCVLKALLHVGGKCSPAGLGVGVAPMGVGGGGAMSTQAFEQEPSWLGSHCTAFANATCDALLVPLSVIVACVSLCLAPTSR
jgi:hypothetical protein